MLGVNKTPRHEGNIAGLANTFKQIGELFESRGI